MVREAVVRSARSEAFVRRSVLEARRLHALPRKKEIDCLAVNTQHTPDANGIESTVVDQTTNGFGVDAELVRDITNADEVWLSICRRHATSQTTAGTAVLPPRARVTRLSLRTSP